MSASPPGEFAVVVEDLRIDVSATGVDVVDEVSFRIRPGEVLGLVGESGSGKTTVGLALLGHTRRGVRVAHGRISVAGHEILSLPTEQRRVLRGAIVSYVPQDPGSALNPNLRIGKQIFEVLAYHQHRRRRREPTPTGRRVPRRGGAPLDRRVPEALPPPALRRPAAARRPRDGLRVPSARARARRADHRPRRDDAGARARHRARSLRHARRRGAVRQSRSRGDLGPRRQGRAHVRRAPDRGRSEDLVLPGLGAPVRPAPDRGDPGDERRSRAAGHPGQRTPARPAP